MVRRLVGQLATDLAEAGVGQAPAQVAFAVGHVGDVEVLDGHNVEGAGQGPGEPVEA